MKKVNISLHRAKRGEPRPLVCLKLYDYEGTEELQKLVVVIEDSLKRNFPSVQVKRNKATRQLFETLEPIATEPELT